MEAEPEGEAVEENSTNNDKGFLEDNTNEVKEKSENIDNDINDLNEESVKLSKDLDTVVLETAESEVFNENQTEIVIENVDKGTELDKDIETTKGTLKVEEKDTETDSGLEDHSGDNVEISDIEIHSDENSREHSEVGVKLRIDSEDTDKEFDIYEIEMGNKLEVEENDTGVKEDGEFSSDNEIGHAEENCNDVKRNNEERRNKEHDTSGDGKIVVDFIKSTESCFENLVNTEDNEAENLNQNKNVEEERKMSDKDTSSTEQDETTNESADKNKDEISKEITKLDPDKDVVSSEIVPEKELSQDITIDEEKVKEYVQQIVQEASKIIVPEMKQNGGSQKNEEDDQTVEEAVNNEPAEAGIEENVCDEIQGKDCEAIDENISHTPAENIKPDCNGIQGGDSEVIDENISQSPAENIKPDFDEKQSDSDKCVGVEREPDCGEKPPDSDKCVGGEREPDSGEKPPDSDKCINVEREPDCDEKQPDSDKYVGVEREPDCDEKQRDSDKCVSGEPEDSNVDVNTDVCAVDEGNDGLDDTTETQDTHGIDNGLSTSTETRNVELENVMAERQKVENQVKMLECELSTLKTAFHSSQRYLQDERAKHNRELMTLKLQLYHSQMELKRQRSKSEHQLSDVMSHLVFLEGRLRKEQIQVKQELNTKANVIASQKKEIVKLKDQNEQLLNAIKEICAKGGMNGYMRENRRKNGENVENGNKNGKEKKGHNGKLGSMKDKFLAKNRSSLELNSFNLDKYLIKNDRLCSSQEDLHRIGDERRKSIPNESFSESQRRDKSPKDNTNDVYSKSPQGRQNKQSQNFFSDNDNFRSEMNKSTSESSHLSETTNSSGIYSLSDHDLSNHDLSISSPQHDDHDYLDDDDDSDRIFSFSSTHINTVIDEEEAIGPIVSHSGQMMSMGSMPVLTNLKDEHRFTSGKNRPHSLSSVDLFSIQQQAKHLPEVGKRDEPLDLSTPPPSPSYVQSKNELTPFQTFKTMFRRKGSKNKGKKRSVSLSQTTNKEYSEALKKHFQKYDMS